MTITNTFSAKIAAIAVGIAMIASLGVASPANAQLTSSQVQSILDLLVAFGANQSTINNVQTALTGQPGVGGAGSTVCPYTWTRNLTIGSTGADVLKLQQYLNDTGFTVAATGAGSPGMETSYYGPATRGAVIQFQNRYAADVLAPVGLTTGTGYFGPSTRAKINSLCLSVTPPVDDDNGTTTDDDFGGTGEGFLTDIEAIGGFSNESVGEGEEDVEVIGLRMEAEDADQMIDRLEVRIDTPTGEDDLEDFISEVSIWLDGEEIGRLDVDDASHSSSNDRYTFRFINMRGIIDENDTAELTVAVSGVNNIDSADEGDGWTITIPANGIRAVSPNGIWDEYPTSAFSETFIVESFASATGVELRISLADDNPTSQIIDVDTTSDTDNVEMLRFTIRADGSDVELSELPITLTVTGASDVDAIANTLTLEADGTEYSENVSTSAATATITFDNLDITIEEDETMEFIVRADVNDIESGTFDEGDTLKAELTTANRNNIEAEDASGEDIADGDKTGTALGQAMAFYDSGIYVTLVSAEEDVQVNDGADNDTGVFTIKYRVEAFDDTVYVSNSPAATTSDSITASTITTDGVLYRITDSGTAITDDLADLVTFTSVVGNVNTANNGIRIDDGEVAEFTLTVTKTNDGDATDDGLYQMALKAIGWNTDDSTTFNVYDFDLEDYETDPVSLN